MAKKGSSTKKQMKLKRAIRLFKMGKKTPKPKKGAPKNK